MDHALLSNGLFDDGLPDCDLGHLPFSCPHLESSDETFELSFDAPPCKPHSHKRLDLYDLVDWDWILKYFNLVESDVLDAVCLSIQVNYQVLRDKIFQLLSLSIHASLVQVDGVCVSDVVLTVHEDLIRYHLV